MAGAATRRLVEHQPLVSFVYLAPREGDLSPARVENLLEQVEDVPFLVRMQFELEHLAAYALEVAERLGAAAPATTRRRRP